MIAKRPVHRWGGRALALALTSLVVACGGADSTTPNPANFGGGGGSASEGAGGGGGSRTDAGGAGGIGAPTFQGDGVIQNPVGLLVADPDRSAWDAVALSEVAGAAEYTTAAAECYAPQNACAQPACTVFATCCVGNGRCCKPLEQSPLPSSIDLDDCAGLDLGACLGGLASFSVFGPEAPTITERGLIPGGTATAEGGAIVGESTDLGSTRARVDVVFSLPINCGSSCLESAGVAFTSTAPGAFVDADVGLLLSGSRSEVSLMLGNSVADTFDAGDDDTKWSIVLSPEGRVELRRNGVLLTTRPFDARALRQASLVLFGRNLGTASSSAAIRSVEVATSFCDIPSVWSERTRISVFDEGASPLPNARFGSAPSIARSPQETRVAYALEGEIYWGLGPGVGVVELSSAEAALSPIHPHEALGIEDPELVYDGSNWHAFYTARDQNGTATIGHAVASSTDAFLTADASPTLIPDDDAVSVEAPTVHRRDGLWVLIAQATLDDGATELRAYYTSALSTGWQRIIDGSLEAATRVENDPASEITDPSLIVHNSGYQLYFSRRSGTRWTVDVLASDELVLWRPLGEALGPAGDDLFDRLGARAPDAISLTDRIDLVYEGQNGVSFELGWAVRPAPSDSAPEF